MRGSSKGVKNKNLIKINNKYLMEYTIITAIKSKLIDKIVLSSDSKKGLEYLKSIKINNNKDNDIYVVCHSHLMTDMYKFITQKDKINNNTKKLFKSDNIWELRIPNHSKQIRIFRHGYSVANMHKDKRKI